MTVEHLKNRDPGAGDLDRRITDLESRISGVEQQISRIGKMLGHPVIQHLSEEFLKDQGPVRTFGGAAKEENDAIESRIGEYGMAWLGNIVLLFGILFFTQYLQIINRPAISLITGLLATGFIYMTAYFTRGQYPYMSRLFFFNGHILLYVIAMQLHFFSESRLVENTWAGHGVVILVLLILGFLAYRRSSQILIVVVWIMTTITAISSGHTHTMLPLITAVALSAPYMVLRRNWYPALIISLFPVYFTFLTWILGNPFLTGSLKIIPQHQFGYIYLFTCALAYSFLAALPGSRKIPETVLHATIILNGLGFSLIMVLATLAFFTGNFYIYFGLIAAFCLAYSIWLQARSGRKNVAGLYALYSFIALSITIAGIYHFSLAFLLLSIESLLVVSMALWFRSKFIVIMNFLLFAGLLVTYLVTSESIHSINFAFALVALVTARVLNWKKKRLEIRTELIRNVYLITGSVMVLWSLHEAVPPQFVTLSWVLSALLFFILSILIPNKKYRWIAIATMVVSVFYLFLVDLKNIGLGYRIIALLIISLISLSISIFYNRGQRVR